MRPWGQSPAGFLNRAVGLQTRWRLLLLAGLFWFAGVKGQASPHVSLDSPAGFFTNVATRLLKSELNLDLDQIQVYPTNQYTPAVHRLLQVTANLYDAMTNRTYGVAAEGFPSVFQPILVKTPTNLVIAGYREITNSEDLLSLPMLDLRDTNAINSWPIGVVNAVAYGIPTVVGARKGFPNFNEFSMLTAVTVSRKLEFWKDYSIPSTSLPKQTNQMIMVGITNVFGAEFWNSYTNPYPRPLQLTFHVDISAYLTNQQGLVVGLGESGSVYPYNASSVYNLGVWPGSPVNLLDTNSVFSFVLPLMTNWWHLPNSAWRASSVPEQFELMPTDAFDSNGFPVPQWWLNVRTRLRCALVDTVANRVVDYVNLDASEDPIDIAAWLALGAVYNLQDGKPGSMWITNRLGDGSLAAPTQGIINQIAASRGVVNANWGQVKNYKYQVDSFRYNFNGEGPIYGNNITQRTNHFFAPYMPTRTIYFATSWQANDPLVHYTIPDLADAGKNYLRVAVDAMPGNRNPIANLLQVNTHFQPWGGGPSGNPLSFSAADPRIKDPCVACSDDWNFPAGESQDLTWLGRVHRGTPWQTFYLKSAAVDAATWQQWTGDMIWLQRPGDTIYRYDSQFMHPTNDWGLASMLVALLSTNSPGRLSSANPSAASGYTALLDGMTVLTNTLSEADWEANPFRTPQFDMLLMQADSPQAGTIAAALDNARSRQPGGYFHQPGDILSVPELSVASPWLNTGGDLTVAYGISEAAYEAIPSQLLPLLRPDSVGAIVQSGETFSIQFTGYDDYTYVVQESADLMSWVAVSTNVPVSGAFIYSETQQPASRFYRSVVLP